PIYTLFPYTTLFRSTLSTNELNLSHCSAIVFSEELAKKGIEPHFDNLANNIEIRPTATIIVANNTAQEFLVSTSESEDIKNSCRSEEHTSELQSRFD